MKKLMNVKQLNKRLNTWFKEAESELQRDHEKKIALGDASEALDRAIEIGLEPTARAQLLTPPVSPIHFTTSPYKYCLGIQIFKIWEKHQK